MGNTPLARLLPLYLVIFMGFVGYSLMITIFTPMLMTNAGGFLPASTPMSERIVLLGILLSLYPLGQFFGSSIIGALSDRFGRRPLLLITLLAATFFYVLISQALVWRNFSLLLFASAIAGLLEANIALAQSAIADLTTKETRAHYFGYIYLSASAAYIIGPLFGGKLAANFTNATPFWACTLLLFATLIWSFCAFKETKKRAPSKKMHLLDAFTNLARIFTSKRLRMLYLINFLLYLSIFGFFRSYPMYLVDGFGMGVSKESEFIAWVALPIIMMNLGLTKFFAARFSSRRLTFASALLTGLFMIFIIVPSGQNWLFLTLFLTAFALALCLPACATLLSNSANAEEQGSAMGNNQSLQVGAEALSSALGGLLAALFVKLSLIAFGLTAILGALLLLRTKRAKSD
jgi:MFS family permease